ncbi:MAG TPA: hypothetical protein VMM38_15655 [Aridibacter sp.]|nr:hypothetical protein [Aridibacter sp.]
MIVARNTFTARPGQAGKLLSQLKDMAEAGGLQNCRFFTDISGDFNTVIMEFEVDSLAAYDSVHESYMTDPEIREKAAGYTELWTSGKREFLKSA